MKARKEDVSMLVYDFSERAEVIVANVFTSFAGGVMHASLATGGQSESDKWLHLNLCYYQLG